MNERPEARLVPRLLTPLSVLAFGGLLVSGVVPWPCPMAVLFHVPCPSCGLTRAARAALSLDFRGATHLHPLWFVVLPLVAVALVVELGSFAMRGRAYGLGRLRSVRVGATLLAGALLLVWIARFFGAFGGPAPVGLRRELPAETLQRSPISML